MDGFIWSRLGIFVALILLQTFVSLRLYKMRQRRMVGVAAIFVIASFASVTAHNLVLAANVGDLSPLSGVQTPGTNNGLTAGVTEAWGHAPAAPPAAQSEASPRQARIVKILDVSVQASRVVVVNTQGQIRSIYSNSAKNDAPLQGRLGTVSGPPLGITQPIWEQYQHLLPEIDWSKTGLVFGPPADGGAPAG